MKMENGRTTITVPPELAARASNAIRRERVEEARDSLSAFYNKLVDNIVTFRNVDPPLQFAIKKEIKIKATEYAIQLMETDIALEPEGMGVGSKGNWTRKIWPKIAMAAGFFGVGAGVILTAAPIIAAAHFMIYPIALLGGGLIMGGAMSALFAGIDIACMKSAKKREEAQRNMSVAIVAQSFDMALDYVSMLNETDLYSATPKSTTYNFGSNAAFLKN